MTTYKVQICRVTFYHATNLMRNSGKASVLRTTYSVFIGDDVTQSSNHPPVNINQTYGGHMVWSLNYISSR